MALAEKKLEKSVAAETRTLLESYAGNKVRRFRVEDSKGYKHYLTEIKLEQGLIKIVSNTTDIKWFIVGGNSLAIVPSSPYRMGIINFEDPTETIGYGLGNFENIDLIIAKEFGVEDQELTAKIQKSDKSKPRIPSGVKDWITRELHRKNK